MKPYGQNGSSTCWFFIVHIVQWMDSITKWQITVKNKNKISWLDLKPCGFDAQWLNASLRLVAIWQFIVAYIYGQCHQMRVWLGVVCMGYVTCPFPNACWKLASGLMVGRFVCLGHVWLNIEISTHWIAAEQVTCFLLLRLAIQLVIGWLFIMDCFLRCCTYWAHKMLAWH